MVSTLSRRRLREEQPTSNASNQTVARVALVGNAPARRSAPVAFEYATANSSENHNHSANESLRVDTARLVRTSPVRTTGPARPHLVPIESPKRHTRKAPLLVRVNRVLQGSLIALCGLAILGYGFDVHDTHQVGRLQDQVRRLSEENSERAADLLKKVSYQDIQNSVVAHTSLRVPEEVKIVKEVPAPKLKTVKAARHHLPLMAGY